MPCAGIRRRARRRAARQPEAARHGSSGLFHRPVGTLPWLEVLYFKALGCGRWRKETELWKPYPDPLPVWGEGVRIFYLAQREMGRER